MTNKAQQKKLLSELPSGALRYTMTNDYMFRAVMQKNTNALKGFLYATLDLPEGSIRSVEVVNPIELGEAIDDKNCILDLKVSLNNQEIINIEMQVNDIGCWPERSLTYLCRSFDYLQKGQDYMEARTTIHIGILDFNLSHLTPEFFSEFKMLNTKNHEVYSDKFILYVVNLTQIDSRGTAGEPTDLYDWAKLFKARTWEEMKMLAEKNSYIEETVVTFHQMTDEEKIQAQCEARERYDHDMASAIGKGRREGRAEGIEEERIRSQRQMSNLIKKLIADNRLNDLEKIQSDEGVLQKLMKEYGI